IRRVARSDQLHARPEEKKRFASAEQRLYQQITKRAVDFDDGLHVSARDSDDGTRLGDDESGVQSLARQEVELGDEVTRPVEEEGTTASLVNVGTLDLSLSHDDQVVGEVAGCCEDLPNRRLLHNTVRLQRRELLVGQLGEEQL